MAKGKTSSPLVGILMGSKSDLPTMDRAAEIFREFGIPHEVRVLSAHRTPDLVAEYAQSASGRGLRCVIAGAGGAAHLAGVLAAQTRLPVLGVPIRSPTLDGLDSLLSTAQMPRGIPVATFAVGEAGAANAALFAVRMLAVSDAAMRRKLQGFHKAMEKKIVEQNRELQANA